MSNTISPTYTATTDGITVSVRTAYLDDQSEPDEGRYVWAYHIRIENNGAAPVQLRARYWRITNAEGKVHEVRGPGVVGKQPLLQPGESFEYTSGTPLDTSSGIMMGRYQMENPDGGSFEIEIPAFSLDSPYDRPVLH